MKYYKLISVLLIASIGNGYGQTYRELNDGEKNKEHPFEPQIQTEWYNDTVPIYRYPITDSCKYYWKKQVYWENKMNAELSRLDRTGHKNDISKNLLRYQDSSIRYKILLERLKK